MLSSRRLSQGSIESEPGPAVYAQHNAPLKWQQSSWIAPEPVDGKMRRSHAPSSGPGVKSSAGCPGVNSIAVDGQVPPLKRRRLANSVVHKSATDANAGNSSGRQPFAALSQQKALQKGTASAAFAEVPTQYYSVLYTKRDQKKARGLIQ
jgi:hypothetical protein